MKWKKDDNDEEEEEEEVKKLLNLNHISHKQITILRKHKIYEATLLEAKK